MRWNRVSPHSPSPASSADLLAHFHKIPIDVGQPVPGFHIFRNLIEKKIKMAPGNMSKSGPVIFVNS